MSKSPTRPRLAPFLVTLLLALLPAWAAQQRRQTRPAPTRPATAAPPARTTQPAETPTRQTPASDAAEDDTTFDTLVAADSYAIYFEARRIGQLVRSKEFADLLDSFVEQSGPAKELTETLDFFKAHAESLENANLHVVAMPTRTGLPSSMGALQLPSVEEAKRVEPTLRGLVKKYETASVVREEAEASANTNANVSGGAVGTARRGAPETVKVESRRAAAKPAGPTFHFKRVGRLLLLSDAPLAARTLRAATRQPLFSSQRLQAARTRLATEQVFVFVDLNLLQKGENVEREAYVERMRKEEESSAAQVTEPMKAEPDERPSEGNYRTEDEILAEIAATAEAEGMTPPAPDAPSPEIEAALQAQAMNAGGEATAGAPVRAPQPEEEAVPRADVLVSALFGMAFGGMPAWPEAVGVGASLGGEDVTVRALFMNGATSELRVIPFLPLLASGPEVVPAASSVAPEDAGVFVSFSLDWQKLYAQALGAMNRQQAQFEAEGHEGVEGGTPPPQRAEQETPEKTIEALEKLFGFKIKEDLIPALGNEVGVSAPVEWFAGPSFGRPRRGSKVADAASPGFVVFVSLQNADTVRRILPRLLEAAGMKTLGASSPTERRAGIEIVNHGGVSTAFLGNYLALAQRPEPLRHVADAFARQGVLASNENFRAAVEWQPRQSLAQVYVSRGLMEGSLRQLRLWADPNDAEFQALITRYEVRPRPAAYTVTHDGGGDLFHELHLPVGLIKLFVSTDTIQRARHTPVRANETNAIRQLYAVADAQEAYRASEGKGSFGTLEQLAGTGGEGQTRDENSHRPRYLSREYLEKMQYRFSITAAGDKYTVVATPKEYGKSGRRSFYLDETGVVRGADHAGQPANAGDPPVDE